MRSGLDALRALMVAILVGLSPGCHEPVVSAGAVEGDEAAFEEQQQAAVAQNPEGVSFTVRLLSPTNVFQQGERIPVELSFSSRVHDRYRLDGARYDRSGRLSAERYRVAPAAGVSDPLEEYFADGIFPGGGIRTEPALVDEPETLVFNLNEWLRFDVPGPYRTYVESSRILDEPGPDGQGFPFGAGTVTSDVLAIEIVPADPAWAEDALRNAAGVIDAGYDELTPSAARVLRYLGTVGAAREMAARLEGPSAAGFEIMLGLIASPHRREAVSFLEERLDAPGFPVTVMFLDTLALLRAWLDRPTEVGPIGPATFQERRAARAAALDGYAAHLADRVEHKTGVARATSVATLMEIGWSFERREEPPVAAPWYARIAPLVPEVFADMPPETQSGLLGYRWRKLAGPAMLPAVRRIVEDPDAKPELRATALQRIGELDPDEARTRILAAIRAPGLSLGLSSYETLAALPDATLPELDEALADRFERALGAGSDDDPGLVAELIARYATTDVAARVRAAWTPPGRADVAGALLAFFTRVDPAIAEELAQGDLAHARATGSIDALAHAAGLGMGPPIERALLDALDERDTNLAAAAARTLATHGSPAAAPHLWRRLERWHAEWRGRSSELVRGFPGPNDGEIALEDDLGTAIIGGAGWLTDGAALARLDALLVTRSAKQRLASAREEWATGRIAIRFSRDDDDARATMVAQYVVDSMAELQAKLAQFPRGTRFAWQPIWRLPRDAATVAAIEAFVTARGMSLEH